MSALLTALAAALGWFALGSHALVPGALARRQEERRRWALAALPLALTAGLVELIALGSRPDAVLEVTVTGHAVVALMPRLAAVLWLALLVADGLLLAGWRRLEPSGWRILAGLGGLCLIAQAMLDELVRAAAGPATPATALLVAGLGRVLLGLAAGSLLLPHRPWLGPPAAAALALHLATLPGALRLAVVASGHLPTLVAAGLALLVAPAVPQRLRRPAVVAGLVLAALWLAAIQVTADSFPVSSGPILLLPPD